MGRAIRHALDQRGLAKDGLARAIHRRRLDVILPVKVAPGTLTVMEHSLTHLAGDSSKDNVFPRLWAANEKGIWAVSKDRSVSRSHPLHPSKLGIAAQYPRRHQIFPSAVLLRAGIEERVIYELPLEGGRLIQTAPGFQVTWFKQ